MDYQSSPNTLRTAVVEKGHITLYFEVYALDTEGNPTSHVLSHSEPVVSRDDKALAAHMQAIETALAAIQAHVLGTVPEADAAAKLRPVARVVEPVEPVEPIEEIKR